MIGHVRVIWEDYIMVLSSVLKLFGLELVTLWRWLWSFGKAIDVPIVKYSCK